MMHLAMAGVFDHTLLKWLEALECDLEFILRANRRGVALDVDVEQRDDRHLGNGWPLRDDIAGTVSDEGFQGPCETREE